MRGHKRCVAKEIRYR